MVGEILTKNPWVAVAVWAALYTSDYLLTIVGARLLRAGADKHYVFERSYEAEPFFQRDVALLRWVSPRFIALLLLSCALVWLFGTLTRRVGDIEVFQVLLGYLILLECAIHVGHIQNIVHFKYAAGSKGIDGRIVLSYWLSLRTLATRLLAMAALFLVAFLLTQSPFMLGGTFSCLVYGCTLWHRSKKASSPG